MIPNIPILTQTITEVTYPTRTYKINFSGFDLNSNLIKINKMAVLVSEDKPFITDDGNGNVTVTTIISDDGDGNVTIKCGMVDDGNGNVILSRNTSSDEHDRINGYIDDIEAVVQAIYLILSTERYQYIIYSWDYGVELIDLFGKPMPYVMSEIPRRITEALTQDDRIIDATDFEFKQQGKQLLVTFTAVTNVGNISTEMEVEI